MEKRKKAGRMRQVIAKNMVSSWNTSPKCDYVMGIDAEPMLSFRKQYNAENECKISFMSIVMKAAAAALCDFPIVNSRFDFDAMEHIYNEKINIGFAMAVEGGLIVLNVKDADKKSVLEITAENDSLIDKANNKKLTMEDMTGGSITINNMGAYRRLLQHSAIINQPELCIMSMYCIKEKPVVREGLLTVGKTMRLALSADHRVIDGKLACDFFERVCTLLENPKELI